jgi:hypothetical protein
VTTDNFVTKEIQALLKVGSRCYYALHVVLKSRRISRRVKLNIYKTIISLIITCARETWVLSRKDELAILIRERKVLGRIFVPMCERGCFTMGT